MTGKFTGKHMAAVMVAGFAVVAAVNFAMAGLASRTFGGLVVENSYVASQEFNGWLDRARQDDARGWNVDISRTSDGRLLVETIGAPADAVVSGAVWHKLGRQADVTLAFEPDGDGRYISRQALDAGRWLVRLEISADDVTWRTAQELR